MNRLLKLEPLRNKSAKEDCEERLRKAIDSLKVTDTALESKQRKLAAEEVAKSEYTAQMIDNSKHLHAHHKNDVIELAEIKRLFAERREIRYIMTMGNIAISETKKSIEAQTAIRNQIVKEIEDLAKKLGEFGKVSNI